MKLSNKRLQQTMFLGRKIIIMETYAAIINWRIIENKKFPIWSKKDVRAISFSHAEQLFEEEGIKFKMVAVKLDQSEPEYYLSH